MAQLPGTAKKVYARFRGINFPLRGLDFDTCNGEDVKTLALKTAADNFIKDLDLNTLSNDSIKFGIEGKNESNSTFSIDILHSRGFISKIFRHRDSFRSIKFEFYEETSITLIVPSRNVKNQKHGVYVFGCDKISHLCDVAAQLLHDKPPCGNGPDCTLFNVYNKTQGNKKLDRLTNQNIEEAGIAKFDEIEFVCEHNIPNTTVYVKTLTGKTMQFNIHMTMKVEMLKLMIEKREGIPATNQVLIFAGRQLQNYKIFANCQVQYESTLHLICR